MPKSRRHRPRGQLGGWRLRHDQMNLKSRRELICLSIRRDTCGQLEARTGTPTITLADLCTDAQCAAVRLARDLNCGAARSGARGQGVGQRRERRPRGVGGTTTIRNAYFYGGHAGGWCGERCGRLQHTRQRTPRRARSATCSRTRQSHPCCSRSRSSDPRRRCKISSACFCHCRRNTCTSHRHRHRA